MQHEGWLVCKDKLRFDRKRSRNSDTLTPAAVQLVRVGVQAIQGYVDIFEKLACTFFKAGVVFARAVPNGVVDLIFDLHDRIEDIHRYLKNDREPLPTQLLQVVLYAFEQVLSADSEAYHCEYSSKECDQGPREQKSGSQAKEEGLIVIRPNTERLLRISRLHY
jgi:hypothetical protein